MRKIIVKIAGIMISLLMRFKEWVRAKDDNPNCQFGFHHLAPVNDADDESTYCDAIKYALEQKNVANIALTGPYGSGKSSVIQTFLKQYYKPVLHISLASFLPEKDAGKEVFDDRNDSSDTKPNRQVIERSILQQMLYGADANKLRLSRFKRIQKPGRWAPFITLGILLGICSLCYLYVKRDSVLGGDFFTPLALSNWINLGITALALVFVWNVLHYIYVSSFGLSLKSISLKNVEIKPAWEDQASILNRHLDEIVYFFQATKYDLVIIEDLDRFENPDIFISLREINSLVNKSTQENRRIKFLYALRDDMFMSTDRTKFFEFVIPIIPIINTSNSIDLVLKEQERVELGVHFDKQFLREVSRSLNDLRLVRNIFNEYVIYSQKLIQGDQSNLCPNKLLSVLIYKNVCPRDFELLHFGEGDLINILGMREKLIEKIESSFKKKVSELEEELDVAERQTPKDLRELKQIYVMSIIEVLPVDAHLVSINNRKNWFHLRDLAEGNIFDLLIADTDKLIFKQYNSSVVSKPDHPSLKSKMIELGTYEKRKKEIQRKSSNNRENISQKIGALKAKISGVRVSKLHELLRAYPEVCFDAFGKHMGLIRYLILEGYLDDTYYQYTSLFHKGRLSANDNRFLIQIRSYSVPAPEFVIDNPKEVIAAMRDDDFGQRYILNITLVDTLLKDKVKYAKNIENFHNLIKSDFECTEEFFDAYYISGRNVQGLLEGIVSAWPKFIPAIIASTKNINNVSQLLSNLQVDTLSDLAKNYSEFREFVSVHLKEILYLVPEILPEKLVALGFKVHDFKEISKHHGLIKAMFEAGLFELTIENLEHVVFKVLGYTHSQSFQEQNYTTLRKIDNKALNKRIESDLDLYTDNILLKLEKNTQEEPSAILALIEKIRDEGAVTAFLEKQSNKLATLHEVPDRFNNLVVELNMIEATWDNCLTYLETPSFESKCLIDYLAQESNADMLIQHSIPGDTSDFSLLSFILKAAKLPDNIYRKYIHAFHLIFHDFPEGLGRDKIHILIDEQQIIFSADSLQQIGNQPDLQHQFVAINIEEYLKDPDSFRLDDEFHVALLSQDIRIESKLDIIKLMDLTALGKYTERATLVGEILCSVKDDVLDIIPDIEGDIAFSLIMNTQPVETQVSLLNKFQSILTDGLIRSVLSNLPAPYNSIKKGYHKPKISKTTDNLTLVKWLDARDFISSYSHVKHTDKEITVNLFRK